MTRPEAARLACARVALGAASLAVTACGAAGAGEAERTVTVAGVSEVPPPPRECPKLPSAPPPPKSVLDEPELDKEIVGLVRDALVCDWGRMGFVYDCEGIRKYTSAWEPFRDGKGQKTLLRMLEDPSEKVRSLAAMRLNYLFESKDPEDVRRVLAVASREKSAMVARDIGLVVGGIDVDATKTIEPLRKLAKEHELYELRVGLASRLLDKNPRSHDALLLTVELTHDKNAEVATAAVGNLAAAKGMYKDEVCAALADAVKAGQDRYAGTAIESLADVGCPAFRDEMLGAISAQLQSTSYPSYWNLTRALERTCDASDVSPEQKKRSASLATSMIENDKVFYGARIEAMKVVMKCEPREGERVIKKYKNDKEAKVREAVDDLLKQQREQRSK